ncbi:hypothetical protein ACOIWI_002941 [Vibrio vulnificus]|nr:hypothetical protein [Vibrio vulnificus]MBY7813073.1 hypothetical protein [Vibrio fluvialis]
MSNIHDAGRLLYLSKARCQLTGKKGRRLFNNSRGEYDLLLQKYFGDEDFKRDVLLLAEAYEVRIVSVTSDGLQLVSQCADAMWATTIGDYKLRLGKADIPSSRLLIIHLAIAMVVFPEAEDLEAPVEDLGVLTVADTLKVLERFSKGAQSLAPDDELLAPLEGNALSEFADLSPLRPDSNNRNADSWVGLTNRVIDHLHASDYLRIFTRGDDLDTEWRVTESYQAAFAQSAMWLFNRFRELQQVANETTLLEDSGETKTQ